MKRLLTLIQNNITIRQNMQKLFTHIFNVTNVMSHTLGVEKIVLRP